MLRCSDRPTFRAPGEGRIFRSSTSVVGSKLKVQIEPHRLPRALDLPRRPTHRVQWHPRVEYRERSTTQENSLQTLTSFLVSQYRIYPPYFPPFKLSYKLVSSRGAPFFPTLDCGRSVLSIPDLDNPIDRNQHPTRSRKAAN